MTGLAIALVLGAALIHASWNYLLKKSGGGIGFVWAFAALSSLLYAPVAVGGAVVGGVIGHQMGGGRGRDVATVLGALGGGLAGNQIEKNAKKTVEYQIVVCYEDGTKGLFIQATPPSWRPGDKVKVINGVIQGRG